MIRFSFTNLVATATITPSSEDLAWPADNIQTPERPTLTARTEATGDQSWVIDHGAAASIAVWSLVNVNVATFRIQANATDSWGAPSYDSGVLTTVQQPTGRYGYTLVPVSAQNFRYNRLVIPSQTPLDSAAYYEVGGLWAGALTSPPKGIDFGERLIPRHPRRVAEQSEGAWRQVSKAGDAYMEGTLARSVLATTTASPILSTQQARQWMAIELSWFEADHALVFLYADDPGSGFILRMLSEPEWTLDPALPTAPLEVQEAMAG